MIKKILGLITALMMISLASAAANFAVTSFACTPSEAAVNEAFSCTAQVQNNGDASGTLGTATLYPDGSWMEQSSYAKTVSTSVSAGQSTEVTFTGLRGVTSGVNGFERITLDSVTDTYVSDEGVEFNTVDVSVTTTKSATTKASGQTFTSTAEVTVGGSVTATLSFAANSGGCTASTSQVSLGSMSDGSKQSRTFTITQGTSGDCDYTISATVTGAGGVATQTDTSSDVVTCSNCASSSSSSSGGGGGGGGGGAAKFNAGTLTEAKTYELSVNDKIAFVFDEENHTIKLSAVDATAGTATVIVTSDPQTAVMNKGDTKSFNIGGSSAEDISVKIESINTLTKIVKITIAPLRTSTTSGTTGRATDDSPSYSPPESEGEESTPISTKGVMWTFIIIGIIVVLVVVLSVLGVISHKKQKEQKLSGRVKVYKESIFSKAKSIITRK